MLLIIFSSGLLSPAWGSFARHGSHGSMCSRPPRSQRRLAVAILAPAESSELGGRFHALPARGRLQPSSYMQYNSSRLWRPASVPSGRTTIRLSGCRSFSADTSAFHTDDDSSLTGDARSSLTEPRHQTPGCAMAAALCPGLRRGKRSDRIEQNTCSLEHPMHAPPHILADLWRLAGGDGSALDTVTLTGEEPHLPSSFRVAAAGQTSIAASALAAAAIWQARSGETQNVTVGMRHAVVECRSERYLRRNGEPPPPAWDAIAGVFLFGVLCFVCFH